MENGIQLTSSTDVGAAGSLSLHPFLAKSLGINGQALKLIKFGSLRFVCNLSLSDRLPLNEASLSSDITDQLNIPVYCDLELKRNEKDEIVIGPFIGILVGHHQDTLKKNLDHLYDYIFCYRQIKGAILAFSLDQVDKKNHLIKGYLYNPKMKKWVEGIFPYPDSIFVMADKVSSETIKHFQSAIGDTVFNDFHLNRWDIYKTLSSSIDVKNYLPEAKLYETPHDLYTFLKRFANVNVKNVNPSHSTPIKVILKDRSNFVIQDELELKNYKFYNRDQAHSIFSRFFQKQQYFIQEAIDVTGYMTINFRVIIVKNPSGQWQVMGLFTRDKKSGGSTRNVFPFVKLGKAHLKELLQLSDLRVSLVYNEIIHIAIDTVKALETMDSHLANAAIDMVIGEVGDIWITDIQHSNPSHEIALVAGFPELYYEILKMNMLYAKKLTGF
nr:YheC/YheD family protein [Neobacillus sp. Marseille-Q6967]